MNNALVIGGGFFGARLALEFARRGSAVTLVERENRLLRRASYNNQARVHNGYHYPRSILTALRSRVNYETFRSEYGDCLDESFVKLYAISRQHSKVNAAQFRQFCARIGAEMRPARGEFAQLFEPRLVEAVYEVKECAFDALKMRQRLERELAQASVEILYDTGAVRIRREAGKLVVDLQGESGERAISADRVWYCPYARMNFLLRNSGLPLIPLKQELAEMALVETPPELAELGITVMDGPFFSCMPFPALGLHTLSHVRYTPHHFWRDDGADAPDPYRHFSEHPKASHGRQMLQDARRYLPVIAKCRQNGSLWEVKTVLPASELDDSRPILYRENHGLPGLTCVLGGKLDNIYDVLQEIRAADR